MQEIAAAGSPGATDSEVELLDGDDSATPVAESSVSSGGRGSLRKDMNLLDAVAFVVSTIIGSGIFITPALILDKTGSFGVSMICWFAGTVIAICGGLCYIELGLLIPRTGAEYVYILQAYSFKKRNKWTELLGSLMAFLYIWTTIIITRPTSTSIISLTCVRYLTRPFYIDCDIPDGVLKCLALSIQIALCVIVSRGVRLMAKINTFVTLLKILAIIFIVTVGLVAISRRGHFTDDIQHPFRGSSVTSAADVGGLALALYSVLWAYSGWENFVCTVEEMKKPERTLPRAMVMGVIIVSLCYFFVNLSFFSILSNDEIVGTQAVALTFGEAVLGKAGLVVFPLLVAVSTLGTNLLNIYVSSRMIFSSAREQQFPEVFCGVHTKWGTPISAVILQACMTAIYISVGDISSLIQGLSAAQWVFICLAFVSVLIMRFTHKDDHRPFKVWWIVPVVMVVVSVFLIFLPLTTAPGLSLAAFGIILSGVPVYFIFVMERPWKLRPAFLDSCSDIITKYGNRVLQAKSARTV